MSEYSAEQLQVWSSGTWCGGVPPRIAGFGNDTRALAPGEAFVALKTASRDGHDFLGDAAARGASCAIVARDIPGAPIPRLVVNDTLEALQRMAAIRREKLRVPVYAVTGSVGKTSTKDLLKSILGADTTHATKANLNNLLGVPLTLLGAGAGHSALVVEAGMSEPGELERSAWMIRPDIAIVTNVRPAHLEGLGTMDAIAREKSALCRHVSARGLSVFPSSLLEYRDFSRLLGRRVPVVFGDEPAPEKRDGILDVVRATIVPETNGHTLALRGERIGSHTLKIGDVTDGMARNAALAAVATLLGGAEAGRVAEALRVWSPSAGRGEVSERHGKFYYVDCYNASPASMADAAACFARRSPADKPRLYVLGGMNELGARSEDLHREVGAGLPLRRGDALALFGGHSRAIGEGAVAAGFDPGCVTPYATIEALRDAIAAFPGSVLLKASRGYALERALPADFGNPIAH